MPTPDKPNRKRSPARKKKTAARKTAPRKKTQAQQANKPEQAREPVTTQRAQAGPAPRKATAEEPAARGPRFRQRPQSPASAILRAARSAWDRVTGQPRPLDPDAMRKPREPWIRRLRHNWRRSRFAREYLPWLLKRFDAYARLTRINKPIGTFLLLWPTLWALWLASDGHPRPWHFVVFVLGTFLMRSAGCAMNDFADRRIDPHVWRTQERPLARREIHPAEALAIFVVLSLAALGLVLTLNRLVLWFALPGAFLAATYPFMKRFTQLPQLYLGVAFGWGIPMAFAAVTDHVPNVAWLLLIINILWATVYDTMYAMADRPDDVKIGVKSTAILFGEMDRTIIGILQVTVLIGLALTGVRLHLAPAYYWGLGAAACFGLYEQWLIREREPLKCFQAFLNNNWFGAAVFAGIILQIPFSH
jgi:4-hydroxybenzoate polyprenyltransferase